MTESEGFQPGNVHGLILYDFGGSPCARRVRITLVEKGVVWDTQRIDLSRLEQRNPEYLKLNPNGFVPTLAHGERVLYESNVITEYLDEVFPYPPLYPNDPWQRAQVKMWQAAESAMAKDYRTLMYQRLMGPTLHLTRTLEEALAVARRSTSDPADLAWEERVWRMAVLTREEEAGYEDRLYGWLDRLEKSLQGCTFLVGKHFTQAEISVYPRVAMFRYIQLRVRRERYPNVVRWMNHLAGRASFQRTLSAQDRGLMRLSGTPTLPWLRKTLAKPGGERTLWERLGLAMLRALFERLTGGSPPPAPLVPAAPKRIRQPMRGAIAPANIPAKSFPKPSHDVLTAPITLYDYRHSPHARRIRVLLLEKQLPWKTVEVDMGRMAHKAPDYLAINPNGELPAIRHGNRVIYDSQLIAEYLDGIYDSGETLHPNDAWLAAQVRMWLALEAGTHKELRPLFYLHVIRPELLAAGIQADTVEETIPQGVHASHCRWLRDTLAGNPRFDTSEELARSIFLGKLDFVEKGLSGGEFLVGDRLTMADVAWFTRIDILERIGIPLSSDRYPQVLRWYEALARRPSIAATMPCAAT